MKILVFGASGSIGSILVGQALQAGHDVTAFVRTPSRLKVSDPRLRVMQGDLLSPGGSLETVVAGNDAVMVAIGDGMKGQIRAAGTRRIIAAMQTTGVRRLICQSTLGAGDSFGNLNWFWSFVFRVPLRRALADHQDQESLVRSSDLDWTIVRPAAFTDGERSGKYQHGFSPQATKLKLKISRADVADFILNQLGQTGYLRQTPGLSY